MARDPMMNRRRKFSCDFKLATVKKVVEKGLSCADVARDLGIRQTNPSTSFALEKLKSFSRSFFRSLCIGNSERPGSRKQGR
jgi:hypothetical protein